MTFEYLTSEQVAERTNKSRRTIRRWVASGRLKPAVQVGDKPTGAHLFRPEDVDMALEAEAAS